MTSQTFAMIKPDATARGIHLEMMEYIEECGFHIIAAQQRFLNKIEAEWLYREHSAKAHFNDLVHFTLSGDVVLLIVEHESNDAVSAFRALMGPTDRTQADARTLRARYAIGLRENSIHGSDSAHSAKQELNYFAFKNQRASPIK